MSPRTEWQRAQEREAYARRREAKAVYNASPERKAAKAAYRLTPEYKETRARHNATPKVRGALRRASSTRRARLRGLFVEEVDIAVLFERDGGVCRICNGPIPWSLEWPHPWSKSHDHIIPLSKDGPHSYANAQLTHLMCNMRKHDKVD